MSSFGFGSGGFGSSNNNQQSTGFGGFGSNTGAGRFGSFLSVFATPLRLLST